MKEAEPFHKKYAGLILILSLAIVIGGAIIMYVINNKKPIENLNTVTSKDSASNNQGLIKTRPEPAIEKDTASVESIGGKTVRQQRTGITPGINTKQRANNMFPEKVNSGNAKRLILNESFAGDWQLDGVEPKAESIKGYLKITVSDGDKASVKSYMQFYYPKSNDTSYLTIFNAFAGCASCTLEKQMKLAVEDVAIGSQVYKTLKQDQPDGGKAGDTIMQAGSNKSIHALVTLQLLNNTTAIIKVQKSNATELSHGLILKPFVYIFRFTKVD